MDKNNDAKPVGIPIKRLPGQSLREEREKLFDNQVNDPLVMMFAGLVVLVIESMHIFGKVQPSLWIGIPIAVVATAYALLKVRKAKRELRNYRQGEEGERIVAQAIEQCLIPKGYAVFHDIQLEKDGRSFNVDHLLVGSNGIFAIETKNYSKPPKGSPEVRYDGKTILWCGKRHTDCDEIAQALGAAKAVKKRIDELTGLSVFVQPVLCAVGWFVKSTDLYGHPVMLVMEKTLGSTIPNVKQNAQFSDADRNRVIAALNRGA